MNETIAIPWWLLVLLVVLALPTLIGQIVIPLWLRVWNRWSKRAFKDINPHLQLKLSPFTLTRYRALAAQLATDPKLLKAASEIAEQRGETLEDQREKLHQIALEIVPAFNPLFYFRVGYKLARSVLRGFYRVWIGFADEQSLESVSSDDSVIFMSNHRSNIDYLLITYLTSQRTMLSFGVGEWSGIFPIRQLMRSAGGYFVRRDSTDPLYRQSLARYVQMATAARVPHAIFPEGALSPDGAIHPARFGLLSYITRYFDPATSPDLVIIPIGTNYDRVAEDNNMLKHDTAEFREKGKLFVIWSGIKFSSRALYEVILQRRSFGYACANFGRPVSFKDWLAHQGVDWTKLDREQRFEVLSRFGNQLMDDVEALIPVTPVAVLARVLLATTENGLDKNQLLREFQACIQKAKQNDAFVVLPRNSEQEALEQALELTLLRGLVEHDGHRYRVSSAKNSGKKALLGYYAKSIAHYY
jgi:glycerol-3-phosphate O-acyltransferase